MVVGGYGEVGQLVAGRLAPGYPGRLVVAGRSGGKAKAGAAQAGHGAAGRQIDISRDDAASALDDVALVVVCLDQADGRFAEQCLARGVHYVDIAASYDFLRQVEALDETARRGGAMAVLSVGVAPGLTNLVAAKAHDQMAHVERLDIFLQLGLGDHHGKAALTWFFDNLDTVYEVSERGRLRAVRSFAARRRIRLPGERIQRAAWRFNVSDQHVLARSLDVPSVSTWICFDSRVATRLFALGANAGLGRLLRRPAWRRTALWLFMNVHLGADVCVVAARASGRTKDGGTTLELGVAGRRAALMTAVVTAETARQVLSVEPRVGVHHSERVIALEPVVSALKDEMPIWLWSLARRSR